MADQSAQLRLTGKQYKEVLDAIFDAFRSYDNLKMGIKFEMSEDTDQFVRMNVPFPKQIGDVIEWAESQDRVKDMLKALRVSNSKNLKLKQVADALLRAADLEKIVSSNPELFSDPDAWRLAMMRAEHTVCRVENPDGRAWGSGFLVGPDLVMTNHHVKDASSGDFEGNPTSVRFRFGFRKAASGQAEGGKVCALATNDGGPRSWLLYESPTDSLDFAIVRLADRLGEEPVSTFIGAPQRRWLALDQVDVKVGQALFILQHPLGDVLKMANGGLKSRQSGWLEYEVDTEPGSSGSPVFDNQWRLVALHSRAGQGQVNRGVDLAAILADIPPTLKNSLSLNHP